jgi:Tfp pilus assembly protein PilN
MTAAESKLVPTSPGQTNPGDQAPTPKPAPVWRRAVLFGSSAGIRVEGANLRVVAARARPGGAKALASFVIHDFRTRPAAEWRTEYLREMKQRGVADLAATVLLPRDEVIVHVAHFPGVADKDMQAALSLELDTFHPYGEDDVRWAWTRLSTAGTVLLGIARTAVMERYETLFREAGVPVSAFTFSASAVYCALRLYSQPTGDFLSWCEAPDGAEGGEVYGESRNRAVFSAQADESLPRALAMGAAELRLPDEAAAQPLDSLLPRSRNRAAAIGPADALAWAAALSGSASLVSKPANLLPADRRETVSRGRLIPTFILVACVILVGIALALEKQYADRRYLNELNAQITQLTPGGLRSKAIDNKIATDKARIELLDRFRMRTKDDLDIVNELTRLLPPPVWISSLEIHPDNVVISGEADQAAPLLKALDSSPLFRNSEFGMAVARNGTNEGFRIKTMRRKPQ